MAAGKANYVIVYKNSAQVYSATNLTTAVNTPLPKGCKPEDKKILFMSFLPDEEELCVFELTPEQLVIKEEKKADDKAAKQSVSEAGSEAGAG